MAESAGDVQCFKAFVDQKAGGRVTQVMAADRLYTRDAGVFFDSLSEPAAVYREDPSIAPSGVNLLQIEAQLVVQEIR